MIQPSTQNGDFCSVRRIELAVVAMIVVVMAAVLVSLAWTTGVTVDEPAHFLSGRLYWEGRDNLKPGDMPPLIKIVSGWVPRLLNAPLPDPAHHSWRDGHEWTVALAVMEMMNASTIQRQFFAARLPMIVFPLATCLLLWWWGRQIFPPWAAVAAAAVFCLSPTVLGHGALVKNDIAASFGYLFFWYRAWRFWRAPGAGNAAWLGGGLLAAVLAKYSMLILMPIAPLLVAARWMFGSRRSAGRMLESLAVLAGVTYLGVLAAWQFRFEPVPADEIGQWATISAIPNWLRSSVAVLMTLPLPGAFWRGGLSLLESNAGGAAYLLGDIVPGGHPLYFIIAMAVKIPSATQVLLLIAVACLVHDGLRRRIAFSDLYWVAPGFLYVTLASLSSLQLGVRLVLPGLVFLFLLTGRAFAVAASRTKGWIAFVVLFLWLGGRVARAYPDYISYFNIWIDDPKVGLQVVSDSNIDWGQDLRQLARWLHDNKKIDKLHLAYFGTDHVWAYFNPRELDLVAPPWNPELVGGATHYEPEAGYYAVSATLLTGQYFAPEYRDYFDKFRDMEPVGRAGNSIFIYRIL